MAKKAGWLWTLGAGAVGIGVWLVLRKKATAQGASVLPGVSTSNLDNPDLPWSTLVYDSEPMSDQELAGFKAWLQTDPGNVAMFKADATESARACLPEGELVDATLESIGGGKTVVRFVFRYLGEIDPATVKKCLSERGV